MPSTSALISAGGIAPLDAPLDDPQAHEVLLARTFAHPALAGLRLVRLVAQHSIDAEDAQMSVQGFVPALKAQPVGVVCRRTLGPFAWALQQYPGRKDLIFKTMRALGQAAALLPAERRAAQHLFEQAAEALERSLPDLLPIFWQAAARHDLRAEQIKPATQCFSRAREAEATYALSAPHGAQGDVAGVRDGLIGGWWRVPLDTHSDQPAIYTRIDGLTYRGPQRSDLVFLKMPGAQQLSPVQVRTLSNTQAATQYTFLDAQGAPALIFGEGLVSSEDGLPNVGFWVAPRVEWLALLQPRDARLSTQLRALSLEGAQVILQAAAQDLPTLPEGRDEDAPHTVELLPQDGPAQAWPHTCAAIEAQLGAGEAVLVGGIAQVALKMRALQLKIEALVSSAAQLAEAAEGTEPAPKKAASPAERPSESQSEPELKVTQAAHPEHEVRPPAEPSEALIKL